MHNLNHFEKFALIPSFDINIDALEHSYLKLQQQFHPDTLLHKSQEEQDKAIINSINVNEAYKILKNPVKRAIYLLKLNGINIDDDNCQIKPSHETLISVLELREKISESKNIEEIEEIKNFLEEEIAELMQIAKENFAHQNLDLAAQNLIKVKYFDKTIQDLKLKKQNINL
jgi:molecular chaperone HscB